MRKQQALVDMGAEHASDRPGPASPLLEISNAMVRVHKKHFGRGPTKARTSISGDVVVCTLEDGFTALEAKLLEHGARDLVIRLRHLLHEAATAEMAAAVESIIGRAVRSHMSATDPDSRMQAEVFVLAPEPPAEGSIREWARATRAASQEVRSEQRAPLAEQRQAVARRREALAHTHPATDPRSQRNRAVAGAATENPGLEHPSSKSGLPNLRSRREPLVPVRRT